MDILFDKFKQCPLCTNNKYFHIKLFNTYFVDFFYILDVLYYIKAIGPSFCLYWKLLVAVFFLFCKIYDLYILIEVEKIVAAIDFGTTYSGFAFSLPRFSESEVILQKWVPNTADKSDASLKTPTSLLLDDKNDFVAFGFDAEEKYKELVEDEKHEHFRFFKNFKMKLHREKVFMPVVHSPYCLFWRSLEYIAIFSTHYLIT